MLKVVHFLLASRVDMTIVVGSNTTKQCTCEIRVECIDLCTKKST